MQTEEFQLGNKEIIMRQPHLLIIISVVIIIIGALFFVAFRGDTGESGITAMEKKELANSLALENSNASKLVYVYSIGEVNKDGTAYKWRYTYANVSNGLEIIIDSNGNYEMNGLNISPSTTPIINWTLDSDDAIEIAFSNPTIGNFLAENSNADVVRIALGSHINSSVWSIEWTDPGFADNPRNARIWIDATTGEIIDVETDT